MSKKRGTATGETLDPPRRVQILRLHPSSTGYFKVGQYGYARVRQTSGGFHTLDAGVSRPGQVVYAVSKAKHGRGGAVWMSEDGIRFTGKASSVGGLSRSQAKQWVQGMAERRRELEARLARGDVDALTPKEIERDVLTVCKPPSELERTTATMRTRPGDEDLKLKDRHSRNFVYLTVRGGIVVGAMGSEPKRFLGLTVDRARHVARYGGG